MYRLKQIITPKLSLRSYNSLEGEILVGEQGKIANVF